MRGYTVLAAVFGLMVGWTMLVAQERPRAGGPPPDGPWNHQIHFATSQDGVKWDVAPEPLMKQASVPDLIELSGKGKAGKRGLLCIYTVDARSMNASRRENLSRLVSNDGGKTWSEPETVRFDRLPGRGAAVDPSVVQLEDGRLRLYFYLMESGPPDPNARGENRFYSALSEDGLNFQLEDGVRVAAENITDPEVIRVGDTWLMFISRGQETLLARSRDGLRFVPDEQFQLFTGGVPGAVPLKDGQVRVYQSGRGGIVSTLYDPRTGKAEAEEGVRIPIAADPAAIELAGGGYAMVLKRWMQPRGPRSSRPLSDLSMHWSQGRAEGKGPVRFTHSPMQVGDIRYIIPMGLMVGGHVTPSDHLYFEPQERNAGRTRYNVYAPADGFIVNIQHRNKLEGTSEAARVYDDYRVVLEHSGTFYSYFDLITQLDPTLVSQLERVPVGGPPINVRIRVKAGDVIGRVGGRTLDFGVINTEVTLPGFVVPGHYEREPWKIHTVDPFDYFDEPLRGQLLALNLRKARPFGGKIDHDIDGRLVGNWFLRGTNGYAGHGDPRGYWAGHLTFAYHHIDPTKLVISLGDYDGAVRQFFVAGNRPSPADVSKATGPVKYELIWPGLNSMGQPMPGLSQEVQGVVLAQLLEDRVLKVEAFPGRTADQVKGFTAAARVYER